MKSMVKVLLIMQMVLVTMVLGGYVYAAADQAETPAFDGPVAPQAVSPYVAPSNVFVPESSKANPQDVGKFAHTMYHVANPNMVPVNAISDLAQPAPADNPGPLATFAEYPASLACIYKMGPAYAGCVPTNNAALNAKGGSRAIAIVDAFDYPNALVDYQFFNSFFGLPYTATKFKVVKVTTAAGYSGANCAVIPYNAGWALEQALDIQWAHAMAPSATIILVQTCDNSYAQLMYGIQVAQQQLLAYGGGQISGSWGGGEWPTESSDWDHVFRLNWVSGKPISYFFSAGDAGLGSLYPASSPWVVAAGGTTINRDPTTQYFQSESCWAGSGGGISAYETWSDVWNGGHGPWTGFQYPQFGKSNRRTPDMSFNADPASGAWVRFNGGWYVVGGTSLSAPALAGIVNNSNQRLGVAPPKGGFYTNAENNWIYALQWTNTRYKSDFYDVTTGSNGSAAVVGWDYCTGVGSPRGKVGK